jgi:hypothetical protein
MSKSWMRKKWIKHHIKRQAMHIACAVSLSGDGLAQSRPWTFLYFLRSDSKVQTFPAISFAFPAVGFKDTALHHFIHGGFHAA